MNKGKRIKYLSPNGTRMRNDKWVEGAWLEDGIVGTITEVHPALPAEIVGGEVFERIEAYAVVTFDNGASTCIEEEEIGKRWLYADSK